MFYAYLISVILGLSGAQAASPPELAACLTGLNGKSIGKTSAYENRWVLLPDYDAEKLKGIYVADTKNFGYCPIVGDEKKIKIVSKDRKVELYVLEGDVPSESRKMAVVKYQRRDRVERSVINWNDMNEEATGSVFHFEDGVWPLKEFRKKEPQFGELADAMNSIETIKCLNFEDRKSQDHAAGLFADDAYLRLLSSWHLYTEWVKDKKVLKDKKATPRSLYDYFEKGLKKCGPISNLSINVHLARILRKMKAYR